MNKNILIGIVVVVLVIWAYVLGQRLEKPTPAADTTSSGAVADASAPTPAPAPIDTSKMSEDQIVAHISTLMLLPSEKPEVTVVSDMKPLESQAFFKNAKLGDIVLMYKQAARAVLYDPQQDKIIEVAPITLTNQAAAQLAPTQKGTVAQVTAPQTQPAQTANNTEVITNSQPCLAIANDAAQMRRVLGHGYWTITVTQAHFNNDGCFYEFETKGESTEGPLSILELHAAPNDTLIATCISVNNSPDFCQNNSGTITREQFYLIEAELLTN